MANLFYRDVKYLFEVVLTIWMLVTSVLYPISFIGGRTGQVMRAQPDESRHRRLTGRDDRRRQPVHPGIAMAAIVSALTLGIAWLVFHHAEYTFAENI